MKSLYTILILLLLTSGLMSQEYVTLYSDCNYRGNSETLRPGRYSLNNTRIGAMNLSSIRIPQNMKVILYNGNEPGTGNMKVTLMRDANCLSTQNWNDLASSIVIEYDNNGNSGDGGYNNNGNNGNNGGYGNNSRDMITVYADCNYQGISKSLPEGYHNIRELGLLNDKVSSVKIPNGYSITLYSDPDYRGNEETFEYSIDCIQNSMNDKTSSVFIKKTRNNNSGGHHNGNYNRPYGNSVIIFKDCDFEGQSMELGTGYHNIRELGSLNDKISSIYVPRGYSVTLYLDPDYKGSRRVVTSDETCLSGTSFDDKISSIFISRSGY